MWHLQSFFEMIIADFAAAKARKLCFWNQIITCKALHRSKSSLFCYLFTILNPKKRFRILQFLYLSCSSFRVKLFAFSFFYMHSSVCPSFIYIPESVLSLFFMTFQNSQPLGMSVPKSTTTRPSGDCGQTGEENKRVQGAILAKFYDALAEVFYAHKYLSLQFMQIFSDDQGFFA